MQPEKLTSASYCKANQIVHVALMGGILTFSLIAFLLVSQGMIRDEAGEEVDTILRWMVPIAVMGGIVASHFIFKQRISECIRQASLQKKLELYRAALIVRYALIEGPAFFSIVACLLTGRLFYLGLAGMLLLVFLVIRPTLEKAIDDLELDYKEREIVNDPDALIN